MRRLATILAAAALVAGNTAAQAATRPETTRLSQPVAAANANANANVDSVADEEGVALELILLGLGGLIGVLLFAASSNGNSPR